MTLLSDLARKKFPSDLSTKHLEKVLTAGDLTLMGIGAIIGTGIFVLTGIAAATQAGPAVVLSFVVAGVACAFAALSYAELASSIGGSGSAYGYSYAAFGEFMAWIIGWGLILEYAVSVEAVANGWSGYFKDFLSAVGLGLPEMLTKGPAAGGIVNLPAVLVILGLMCLLISGVRHSARLNAVMVCVKLLTVGVFIAVASQHINPANWAVFAPFGWFGTAADGTTHGILAGASVVFFAYVGFDAVSTAVEEAKDPQRDAPIGILASLVICTVVYIIVAGLLTLIANYKELNVSSPVAHALMLVGVNWASALVATGVIAGLIAVMLVLYYGLTRILLSMASDGLLPRFFAEVSDKTHTPVKNTVVCGLVMAAMAGFIPLGVLVELVNIGTLVAFVLVCAGVIALRRTAPDMKRPFKMPGGIILPALGVVSCLALIGFLPLMTHLRYVAWIGVGLVVYFAYSRKRSLAR